MSDYGFNKLIELFEAVPGTVEVTEDPDGERLLQLTDSERLSVVAEQIATLVKSSRRQGCIISAYLHAVKLSDIIQKKLQFTLQKF